MEKVKGPWCEFYRPATIDDCVLPEATKETFREYVKAGKLPTLMFSGSAGVGKTTAAKALCNEIGADWIMINGSDEGRKIDVLRTKIRNFASTVSFSDAKKVVIIDEADYMNLDSVQPAMRGFIEEFANNCSFIFTCNFKHKIIAPLHSRCAVFDFKIPNNEKQKVAAQIFKRVCWILEQENITYDKKVIAELVQTHFPDFRKLINDIQRYSVSGSIDSGILVSGADVVYEPLIDAIKNKKFKELRKWVTTNADIEPAKIFTDLYEQMLDKLEGRCVGQIILTIADYMYKSAFVANQEINTVACLVSIMQEASWK